MSSSTLYGLMDSSSHPGDSLSVGTGSGDERGDGSGSVTEIKWWLEQSRDYSVLQGRMEDLPLAVAEGE